MDDKEKNELNDEELENVVAGFEIGDHVRANSRSIRYCPGCGKLAMYSYGTIVGKTWYEKKPALLPRYQNGLLRIYRTASRFCL